MEIEVKKVSFIQKVEDFICELAPKEGALHWDNTGILIDSDSFEASSAEKLLLTIDFTEDVLLECINKEIKNVLAYHPVIFNPLKKLDGFYVKCIKNSISVYSPHTQLDPKMNEYLLDLIGENPGTIEDIVKRVKQISGLQFLRVVRHDSVKNGQVNCLKEASARIYKNNGDIKAGVGAAFRSPVFSDCLLITGEMSHHDLLKCVKNKVDVILMEHSNSERIYLKELKSLIEKGMKATVEISEQDRDPVEII